MSLVGLLVTLIIAGLIFYLLYWLLGQIPLPPPFKTVALVILGLVAVLYLIDLLFGLGTVPMVRIG